MTKTVCENIARKNTKLRNTKGQEEKEKKKRRNSLVVQWVRPGAFMTGPRFDPGWGSWEIKIPQATWHGQYTHTHTHTNYDGDMTLEA